MVKNLSSMQETQVWSLSHKIPWRREWLLTPVFLPGEFHGQSLVSHSSWGCKESDMTEQLTLFTFYKQFQNLEIMYIRELLESPWNFLGKNIGVGCHFLLQGNLLIQGLNPSICISCIGSWILYHCAAWEWQLLLYLVLTLLHAKQPDLQWVFLFTCGLETRNILQVGTLFFNLKKEFYKYSIINNKSRLWGG